MTRSSHRRAPLAPLALLALSALAGCQDYNFSPVNQCLIQPGTERVTLSDISTADVLFVVDDSGSMGGEQQSLSASFGAFVTNLTNTNQVRVQNGLEPIDFHIAITTTSVYLNRPVAGGATCKSTCDGKAQQVCCATSTDKPLTAPRPCDTEGAACTAPGGPWTCKSNNVGLSGEKTCGDAAGNPLLDPVPCATVGDECGQLQQRYTFTHGPRSCTSTARDCRAPYDAACKAGCAGAPATGNFCCDAANNVDPLQCNPGVADQTGVSPFGEYTLYPRGDFVKARTSASGAPPRVIHFDKNLFCTRDASGCVCTHAGSPTVCDPPVVNVAEINKRIAWFNANVLVGTCGSGQEQGLEGARRAVQKALHLNGQSQPPDVLPAEWPHANSKLVTVWVGDEDDCSSPEDASQGVIFSPVSDTCTNSSKLYGLDVYSSFLTGLGRPLATGFIVSAVSETCDNDPKTAAPACQPGICCDTYCTGSASVCTLGGVCGGQGPGQRFLQIAGSFTDLGADVVEGSICHPGAPGMPPDFSSILDRVAEVVKQPTGLQLPTQPATAELTILRIATSDGTTRKTCTKPAPVGTTTVPNPITGAVLNDFDWWFTDGNDLNSQVPQTATRFITLNASMQRCVANPGETYSADYLGLVPTSGCNPLDLDPGSGQPRACVDALGLRKTPWVCQKEAGAPASALGTCLCGS